MPAKQLNLQVDRSARVSLSEQIRIGITEAILNGVLTPGSRLPSWIDLAVQLGVSRGTVKAAYERLTDEQLVISSRAQGTCVAQFLPARSPTLTHPDPLPGSSLYQEFFFPTGDFQMGIPASDAFPSSLFSRMLSASARSFMNLPQRYSDPRGEPELKREIAAQLVLSRVSDVIPRRYLLLPVLPVRWASSCMLWVYGGKVPGWRTPAFLRHGERWK